MSSNIKYPHGPIGPWGSPLDFTATASGGLGIYTAETTKRFAFGTRVLTWDGSVYKYSKAASAIVEDVLAWQGYSQHIDYGANIAATTAVGDSSFKVDISATMGAADDGVIAEDELEGGRVIVYSDTISTIQRGIVGNDAVATGEMKMWVEYPIDRILTVDASFVEAICSPYNGIKTGSGGGSRGMVGLPCVTTTSGNYLFIQTWGLCWIAPQSDVGAVAGSNQIVARHDGSVQEHENYSVGDTPTATEYTNGVAQQHIGFVVSHAADGTQGAPFVMLQISI